MDQTLDIGAFEDLPAGEYRVRNPQTGAPTAAVIMLAGPEHPLRKKAQFDRQRRIRTALATTGKMPVTSPEESEAEETDLLVEATIGWRGLRSGGQDLAHSKEAARQLFTDPKRQWLRAQVRDALDQRELFIGASASN